MRFHNLELLLGQLARLVQNRLGYTDFPDVVQQCRLPDNLHRVVVQPARIAQLRSIVSHIFGMVEGIVVFSVYCRGERINGRSILRVYVDALLARKLLDLRSTGRADGVRRAGLYSVFVLPLDLKNRHVCGLDKLLGVACRVRYRAHPAADRQHLQHVFRMAEIFVDVHYLQPDIFGEIGRRADVIARQQHRKLLAAVPRYIAVPADRCIDNLRHTLECQVALFVAVKLVIQLEIVQIQYNQR